MERRELTPAKLEASTREPAQLLATIGDALLDPRLLDLRDLLPPGAVAQMLQAEPEMTPAQVKFALQYSAQPLPGFGLIEQGAGSLNVPLAVKVSQSRNLLSAPRQVVIGGESVEGGRIAFGAVNGSHDDLFVMNSDGSHIEQLTNDEHPDRGPVWSSDGTSLYFYSQRNDRYETYTIRPDGGGLTQITRSSGPGLAFPRPSPDGSLLAAMTPDGSLLWDVRASRAQPLPLPAADRVTSDPR